MGFGAGAGAAAGVEVVWACSKPPTAKRTHVRSFIEKVLWGELILSLVCGVPVFLPFRAICYPVVPMRHVSGTARSV